MGATGIKTSRRAVALLFPVFDANMRWCGLWLELGHAEGRTGDDHAWICSALAVQAKTRLPLLFVHDHTGATPAWIQGLLPMADEVVWVGEASPEDGEVLEKLGVRLGQYGRTDTEADYRYRIFPATVPLDVPRGVGNAKLVVDRLADCSLRPILAERGFGYFVFSVPEAIAEGRSAGSSRATLMNLLSMVTRDADTLELEELFKHEPKLAFDLLRLVNSPALGLRTKATSFRHAITILGRRQLQRWLQLLLFAQRNEGQERPSVLMWHSASRGRAMELLCSADAEKKDRAFMVGVFSLLPVLMNESMGDLVTPLGLPEDVEYALLDGTGSLGAMLRLIGAAEKRDFDTVYSLFKKLGISASDFLSSQFCCMDWVSALYTE